MVLFDEDPVILITETTAQFHIPPDKESLTRIADSQHTLASARSARLSQQQNLLTSLTRRLNNLKGQYDYEAERHDAGKHVEEVLRLDHEKYRVAKGASDAEVEGERLAGELAGLKAVLARVEGEGVGGGRTGGSGDGEREDELVLKVQFYRSLGIDATQDQTTGEFTRAVVRHPERGDVNVVNIDGQMSRSFYANMIWDSL